MKTIKLVTLAGMVLALVAGTVLAQEQVDEKRPASADGIVEIHNMSGSVQVVGWNRKEVAVSGTLGEGSERLEFSRDSYRTTVRVVIPEGQHKKQGVGSSHLKIQVPKKSQVEVETTGADIEVAKVTGTLILQSVSGNIRVQDGPGEVDAKSVRGDVEISVLRSRVKAASVGGRVTLRGTSKEADVSTVSGKIVVDGGRFERGRFKSVSGDVRFEGALDPKGAFDFSSHSGNVELVLPGNIKADFRVSAFSGEIENELGPRAERTGSQRQRRRLTFSTGFEAKTAGSQRGQRQAFASESAPGFEADRFGGSPLGQAFEEESPRARISVTSFSGNVRLKVR